MGEESTSSQPPKKSAGKTLLSCCCLFFVLMMLIGAAIGITIARNISDDPATVAAGLPSFLDATIPPGYSGVGLARVPFFAGVAFIAPTGTKLDNLNPERHPLIIIVVDPPADKKFDSPADVQKNLPPVAGVDKLKPEAEAGAEGGPKVRVVKIRGEDVQVLEQLTGAPPTRVHIAIVPRAKGDPHKIGIIGWGKAEGFDQPAFDKFLESIQ